MDRIKLISLISGAVTILFGYWLLAVPVELPYEKVIFLAKSGMITVFAGSIVLMVGIWRRS